MKLNRWSACLVGMFMMAAAALAQQPAPKPDPKDFHPRYGVRPWKDSRNYADQIGRQSANGMTIPLWSYSVKSPIDNQIYSGMMVGRAPYFHGHRTTEIPTVIIPVIFTFQNGGVVYDPTTPDACLGNRTIVDVVSNSPIFHSVDWVMNGVDVGNTQYVDGFQRAEFWQYVGGTPYHTHMGLSTARAVSVTVPVAYGTTYVNQDTNCALGAMDYDWWDNYVQHTLIPSLSNEIGPANFPIFLSNSVVEYPDHNLNECCILGYHGDFFPNGILQTYTIATLDDSGVLTDPSGQPIYDDLSVMSHEVGEWMNDPTGDNPTPLWGHIGQVSGCQNNLEVGDPLSFGGGSPTNEWVVQVPMNDFTYHLQELAYFSWFYRIPSIGAGGLFSDNHTFVSDAGPVCQ